MADPVNTTAPAAPAPTPTPTPSSPPPNSPVPKDAVQTNPIARDVANEANASAGKSVQRGGIITNPAPVPLDPDVAAAQAAERDRKLRPSVPQSTIDEMAAGKAALERNRPVAAALEQARLDKDAGDTKPGI